jgi:hypothetical protein
MFETILGLVKGKTLAQMALDIGFEAVKGKLSEYRSKQPDFTEPLQNNLEKFLLDNWKQFVKLTLYSGINGLFTKLREETAKTPSPIDDVQVQAIEYALRALIESFLDV